ncbi:MAG: hypothetical protein B5766_08080 [Candidatus Lumbricidophila eiseniae]|uniref:VTT domain-containing protein n=1 Tax=Candidatus Lumbricidiphila eiseniae TaxID=1969409 RepID=A0A2A6FR40_9MICO|nr:MAG: hypothetical protein B5766_08080 [Candidatus Lumbricidophila eiseniae]
MLHTVLIPWLDPTSIIAATGPWALAVVALIVFAETGLLIGFLFPGDTLLLISGLLSNPQVTPGHVSAFGLDVWWVCLVIAGSAIVGGEVGYQIGHRLGPTVFERKESGIFSVKNVERTNLFFERFGALAVILARFVPIVRTFVPIAAGVGHMNRRKYSLYNLVGAIIWGVGVTLFGYFIGFIEPIATFVQKYIDVILLGAVAVAIIPTVLHYVQASRSAKRALASGAAAATDREHAEKLALDPDVFGRVDSDRQN